MLKMCPECHTVYKSDDDLYCRSCGSKRLIDNHCKNVAYYAILRIYSARNAEAKLKFMTLLPVKLRKSSPTFPTIIVIHIAGDTTIRTAYFYCLLLR